MSWISLLICLGITSVGWWVGRPLTPELLAMLGVLTGWSVRMESHWRQRLADHRAAITALAARQQISTTRAEAVYALVERQIEADLHPPHALPPGRRRP